MLKKEKPSFILFIYLFFGAKVPFMVRQQVAVVWERRFLV